MTFRDVPESHTHYEAIEWLAAEGITRGAKADDPSTPANEAEFAPDRPISRGEFASLMKRYHEKKGRKPAPTPEPAPSPEPTPSPKPSPSPAPGLSPPPVGVALKPTDSIQAAVNAHPNGTVFGLAPGVYTQRVVPRFGNRFVGADGAILDGGGDGRLKAAFDNGGAAVELWNLEVRNYDVPLQNGAIQAAGAWKVYYCDVHHNGFGGGGAGLSLAGNGLVVYACHLHHNDQIGAILQDCDDARVAYNEIDGNNPNNNNEYGFAAGAVKILRSHGVYIGHNHSHHNHGPGLWTDHNNSGIVFEHNLADGDYGPGIFHEVSYSCVIRYNTVVNCNHRFYIGGILVSCSSDTEIHDNVLADNGNGIIGLQDDRGSGERGVFQTTRLNVHHNKVSWSKGRHGLWHNSGPSLGSSTFSFKDNEYHSPLSAPFVYDTDRTWSQWQALGFDAASTLN